MNKEYLDFIDTCRSKNYERLITHKHHVIPKHMGGGDSFDNIIELSLEDHYTAHILLSECYDGKYKRENLASAIMIKGYLDNIETLNEYQKSLNGEGNPNYGNKWSENKKRMASQRTKEYWSILENKQKIMKPKSNTSKMGKSDKTGNNNPFFGKQHSEDTKNKIREKRMGKKPSNMKQVMIDNTIYESLTAASKQTGLPPTTILWRINSKNKKYENYQSHPAIKAPLSN